MNSVTGPDPRFPGLRPGWAAVPEVIRWDQDMLVVVEIRLEEATEGMVDRWMLTMTPDPEGTAPPTTLALTGGVAVWRRETPGGTVVSLFSGGEDGLDSVEWTWEELVTACGPGRWEQRIYHEDDVAAADVFHREGR